MSKSKPLVAKNHKILNHPYLALILLPLWCSFVASILGGIFDSIAMSYASAYAGGLGTALATLVCLAIHKKWFRGEFDGNLKTRNFKEGLLLISPTVVFLIMNLSAVSFSEITGKDVFNAFCLGTAPGVLEEVAFRGLSGSNFMRLWKEEKKIPLVATLTAVLFGAFHLLNISAGAGVASSVTQAVYAYGAGVIFAAVYLRTGSLLASILSHALVDTTAYMTPGMIANAGVMTDSGFEWGMVIVAVIGLGYGALGYYYLRPSKRAGILQLWSEKWTVLPTAEELAAQQQAQA